MGPEVGARDVAVDEAGIGVVVDEPGHCSGTYSDVGKAPLSGRCAPRAARAQKTARQRLSGRPFLALSWQGRTAPCSSLTFRELTAHNAVVLRVANSVPSNF